MAQSDPATRLGEKFAHELEEREKLEAEGVPMPTEESNVKNLMKLLEAFAKDPDGEFILPDEVIEKSKKSGQYRFHKSDQFETTYSDGTVRKGLHGIGFYATPHSTYKGPRCENCGRMHDLKKCSRCKEVFYCDTNCQSINWSVHKSNCKPKTKD